MKLDTSVQYLKGVGPKMAEKLERLGIKEVRDLLFYYPFRYDDFSRPRAISSLRIGDDAIIKAKIISIKKSYTKRKWMTLIEAELSDNYGKIKAVWFNQPFLLNILKPDNTWLFAGKIAWDYKSKTKIINVYQYENLSADGPLILPVYSETAGITSKYIRKIISQIFHVISEPAKKSTSKVCFCGLNEYLPEDILKAENLIGLAEAINKIHCPRKISDIDLAKKRLAFDELFFISLQMLSNKKELSKSRAIALAIDEKLLKEFVKKLPFKLTNAQRRTAWEIILDLQKEKPMNRLLEGDVGSGKTVVAAMSALVAIKSGYQVVWLAPTEILANQHFANVSKLLKLLNIKIGLWTGANKKSNLLRDDLIIGTHALLQKNIKFNKLVLIIVDEQHRFGVKQRAQLKKSEIRNSKSEIIPHFLSMTATPIPRSLALAFYGDLDISIINELPKGRKNITTKIISPNDRQSAYDFIESQVKKGRQVFVICPMIEIQSQKSKIQNSLFDLDKKSAIAEYNKLSKEIFPHLKIGLLHGKMKSKEKDEIMQKFKENKINILVSTAVIEVGIDIANASVMMIESAERFGLAQLHQFRGRVGRGNHQSYCFLFSDTSSENTQKRLNAMINCNNGFQLAQIDLELRGPGELSGIRQSGLPALKMASLTDRIMIEKARKAAENIINNGIEKYPELNNKLQEMISSKHME